MGMVAEGITNTVRQALGMKEVVSHEGFPDVSKYAAAVAKLAWHHPVIFQWQDGYKIPLPQGSYTPQEVFGMWNTISQAVRRRRLQQGEQKLD